MKNNMYEQEAVEYFANLKLETLCWKFIVGLIVGLICSEEIIPCGWKYWHGTKFGGWQN